MANRFIDKGKKLSERDLREVEAKLGFSLPAHLRAHYLKNNGGDPTRHSFRTKDGHEYSVGSFLTMKYPSYEGEILLEDNYLELCKKKKIIKKDLIPFAEDEGGDPYCIHRRTQAIYCFSMEFSDDPKRSTRKVAPSLTEFIEGMLTERDFYKAGP
jgi:cell wall assembly regulator SMI1